jgi:pimeloyl-ACP methyl ester carboxylesterase
MKRTVFEIFILARQDRFDRGVIAMATFILVHGAFQGGWVWRFVARDLRAMGHDVHTPTFSGCGYLHHGLREGIELNTFIQDIDNYIHFEEVLDPILVAHSYSGMICSAIMMRIPHRLRQVVFLDAIIPEPGCSFAETAGEAFRLMLDSHRLNAWKVKPWPIQVFGVSGEQSQWFQSRLCTFPLQAFLAPFPGEFDAEATYASFISCTLTTSPFIRKMAEKAVSLGWPVIELEAGHCPMVTQPSKLAGLLNDSLAL